jgi:hypothetical protein
MIPRDLVKVSAFIWFLLRLNDGMIIMSQTIKFTANQSLTVNPFFIKISSGIISSGMDESVHTEE